MRIDLTNHRTLRVFFFFLLCGRKLLWWADHSYAISDSRESHSNASYPILRHHFISRLFFSTRITIINKVMKSTGSVDKHKPIPDLVFPPEFFLASSHLFGKFLQISLHFHRYTHSNNGHKRNGRWPGKILLVLNISQTLFHNALILTSS